MVSEIINLGRSIVTEETINAEYIWVGGSGVDLRSKGRTLLGPVTDPSKLPKWSNGGSCRGLVNGENRVDCEDSEVILHPRAIFRDPFREGNHILVACDACNEVGDPIHNNKWGSGASILSDSDISSEEPRNTLEQTYTLLPKEAKSPLSLPVGGLNNPQGCGIGADKAFVQVIVDAHYKACLYAGINISSIESEVSPGKWGYKVGPAAGFSPQSAPYELWVAHYILERITEAAGVFLIPGGMFDHYKDKTLKAITLAQEEAKLLGHNLNEMGELISEDTGISAKVLMPMEINLNDPPEEAEEIIEHGREFVGVDITIDHHLNGADMGELISEDTGIAAKVLMSMGANLNDAPQEVEGKIEPGPMSLKPEDLWPSADSWPGSGFNGWLGANINESESFPGWWLGANLDESERLGAGFPGFMGANLNESKSQVKKADGVELPELNQYSTNLSKLAKEGKLDPVSGRQEQIERVTQILGRRTKNNPCLIGEPGVGKTAIVEGLAQRIANGDVPDAIKGKQVYTLDVVGLVAGTKYVGKLQKRMKKLMDEITQSDDIILFIDELHTLIGAGAGSKSTMDVANILKPALARGQLRCIGATTLDEYRSHIEKDPALERRFQSVTVPEPTVEETVQILKALQERYETHHLVRYTDEALVAAAKLSDRYISDRFLPDKAIDLVDEAGSRVQLQRAQLPEEARELEQKLRQITKNKNEAIRNQDLKMAGKLHDTEVELKAKISTLVDKRKKTTEVESEAADDGVPLVTEADIQHIVFSWTSIPVEKLSIDDSKLLLKMEETLHKRLIGQDDAVIALSRAIQLARVGLENPNRPIASFIFTGPTGVGKSELAKTLAACYFGSEKAMIRIDMSEFSERHTVSKLIGSPPGYVGYGDGGNLTEAVRRRPYTVVLFDEIEKAHSDIFNVMLQILEDGRLTDGKGRTVNFKNTVLIMTSNLGSSLIERGSRRLETALDDKEKEDIYSQIKSSVTKQLKQHFKPEFLNRLDDIIVFRQLTKAELKEIADIMLKEVIERLKTKRIQLQTTETFRDSVVEEGYDPKYGARPLRRVIKRLLTDSMARKILACEIKEGDSVTVDVDSSGNVIFLDGSSVMELGNGITENRFKRKREEDPEEHPLTVQPRLSLDQIGTITRD